MKTEKKALSKTQQKKIGRMIILNLVPSGRVNTPQFNANDNSMTDNWDRPGGARETIEVGNVYPASSNALSIKDATRTLSITGKRLTKDIALPLPGFIGSPDSQEDFYSTIAAIANVLPVGVSITNVRRNPTNPKNLQVLYEKGGFTDIIEWSSNDSVSYTLKMQMLKTGWLWADQVLYTCLKANADVQIQGDTLYWGQPTFGGWIAGGSRPVRTFDSPFQFKDNILLANGDLFLSKSKFNIIIFSDDFGGGTYNQVALDYNIRKYVDNVDFK